MHEIQTEYEDEQVRRDGAMAAMECPSSIFFWHVYLFLFVCFCRFCFVVVVVFFTLTDRASTIHSNTRGCQSGTWSAGQKKIRGTSTKLQ